MGVFMRGSLNPPAQPPVVVDDEGNPPPTLCIIDRVAYITDVTNASIAWCNATDNYNGCGVTIQVQTSPQPSRDVAVIDRGRRLKYVQLHLQVTMHRLGGVWGRVVPSYDDWKAARWSMDTARPSSGWRQDSEVVHGSEVGSTIDPALLEPPPYGFDVDKGLPLPQIFEKHYTSLPVISLHDDSKDVVYFSQGQLS
ncbi:hypothetical protein ZWY2020_037360 [Hordeum vulgare]|nr:hypothetical protein ZWY2020_037360 [Hordeum vulgare]